MKLRNGKVIKKVIEKVECKHCEETFDNATIFKDHDCPDAYWCDVSNEFHENEKFICDCCEEQFNDNEVFKNHDCPDSEYCDSCNNFHENETFICYCCEEQFNDNEVFKNHYCPDSEYCDSCKNFHFNRKEKKLLNDNTELKIEDTKGEIIDMTCIVCLTNKRSVLFLPCAHLACCNTCNSQIESTCPVCRGDISEYKQVILC
jgi:hypothetical protein